MLLRNAPWRPELDQACHWRIELLPRLNPLAGLELATGVHINPVPPEKAAARLRAL
jgi:UDPglucose--hexose-1-phosphate uridylyltransferase